MAFSACYTVQKEARKFIMGCLQMYNISCKQNGNGVKQSLGWVWAPSEESQYSISRFEWNFWTLGICACASSQLNMLIN